MIAATTQYANLRQSHSMSKLGNSSCVDLRKNARRIGTLTELKARRKSGLGSSYDCSGKTIIYEGKRYEIHEGETVTTALQRIKGENWDAEELVTFKKIEEVPEKQEEQAPEVVDQDRVKAEDSYYYRGRLVAEAFGYWRMLHTQSREVINTKNEGKTFNRKYP